MISRTIVYFLLILVAIVANRVLGLEEPIAAEKRDAILDFDYPTHHTNIHNALLKNIDKDVHTLDVEKREKVLHSKHAIEQMVSRLLQEEIKLNQLKNNVSALKKDFFWFFHAETRLRVDEAQMLVNEQERVIEHIIDHIVLEWKRLKPLYGIYSTMFLTEALGFVPEIWKLGMNLLTTLMELGLISLLLFGSLTGFMLSLVATLGFSFLPSIIGFSTLVVNIYWVFQLPFIMIQYAPSISEFLGVYFAFVGVLMAITFTVFKLVFPDRIRIKTTRRVD